MDCVWVDNMRLDLVSKTLKTLCMMGLTFILSSCFASNAPNLIGKRANYDYSDDISALRDANRGVKVFSSIPERATNIKSFSTIIIILKSNFE